MLTDEQIKHMVQRFLGWRLPENFRPDCGIHFDADAAIKLNPRNGKYEPVGTNLFDAQQAEAMVRYMVEGAPDPALDAARQLVSLFSWEPAEDSGEIEPHLDALAPAFEDALTALRDALAPAPLAASSRCPLCGVDTPHNHTAAEIPAAGRK